MIYRTDKKTKGENGKVLHPHTEIDNRTVDSDLSFETLGLLVRMLRNIDTWDFSVTGLAKATGVGKDRIRTMIRELKAKGYITEIQQDRNTTNGKKRKGTFEKIQYTILEFPSDFTFDDNEPFEGF